MTPHRLCILDDKSQVKYVTEKCDTFTYITPMQTVYSRQQVSG